ncbi:hypothetical protein BU17DRAFT_69701 [Hysterangium stoloniferum]|nr:hypothetical protein BU17DRAFT_69701 [Hysterangium stoloniferum]
MSVFDDTFGAWFVGMEVSNVAFGFAMLQIWIFCQNWQSEPLILKFVVVLVLVLSFLLVFLTSHGMYYYLVTSIGDLAALSDIVWYELSGLLRRSDNNVAYRSFKAEPWISVDRRLTLLNDLWKLSIITGGNGYDCPSFLFGANFLHCLWIANRRTKELMNRLTLYTFASGFLTVVGSAVVLSLLITKPTTQTYSGASFVLPHLYANCLLALLNSRRSLRENYVNEAYVMDSSTARSIRFNVPTPVVTNAAFPSKGTQSNDFSTGISSSNFTSVDTRPLTPLEMRRPPSVLHVEEAPVG